MISSRFRCKDTYARSRGIRSIRISSPVQGVVSCRVQQDDCFRGNNPSKREWGEKKEQEKSLVFNGRWERKSHYVKQVHTTPSFCCYSWGHFSTSLSVCLSLSHKQFITSGFSLSETLRCEIDREMVWVSSSVRIWCFSLVSLTHQRGGPVGRSPLRSFHPYNYTSSSSSCKYTFFSYSKTLINHWLVRRQIGIFN